MRIGELARKTGFTQETIRYYERIDLLSAPNRSEGNYREYGPGYVDRLRFIGNCRSLDMTLEEVRQLLELKDNPDARCGEVDALLDEHLDHVRHRVEELTLLASQLRAIRDQCGTNQAARDCGILNELDRMTPVQSSSDNHDEANHVPGSHGHRPA